MAVAHRCLLVLATLCAAFGLAGCASSSTGEFELDPAYWFPDGKKKLPGERREVFPGGVPGVTQGIPPELVRGNAANQIQPEQALAPAPVQEEPKPQAQEKPKPRPKKVARPAPQQEPQAQPAGRAAPPQQPPAGAWPAPQPQAQQPQQSQPQPPASSAWPAPPASGTFTR